MIKEIKDILEQIVSERVPEATIARSFLAEKKANLAQKWPVVAFITNPGRFDDSEAKIARYFDEQVNMWKQRYIRGKRILPVLIRCWAVSEEAADTLFSSIIPYIPSRWSLDNFQGEVTIVLEEHSDHAGNTSKLYVSIAVIEFSVPVARDAVDVPVIDTITFESEYK
ncbi:MAG: hypothetical protein JXB88_26095 [Spirochaetales bacterium]|nr:hypothetical protein [Spirochaetales bacterium]